MLHESSSRLSKVGFTPPCFSTPCGFLPNSISSWVNWSQVVLEGDCPLTPPNTMHAVSGNLNSGCCADCNHCPASQRLWSPHEQSSAGSNAAFKGTSCFVRILFAPPNPQRTHPALLYVLFLASPSFLEVLPGRFMGWEEGGWCWEGAHCCFFLGSQLSLL